MHTARAIQQQQPAAAQRGDAHTVSGGRHSNRQTEDGTSQHGGRCAAAAPAAAPALAGWLTDTSKANSPPFSLCLFHPSRLFLSSLSPTTPNHPPAFYPKCSPRSPSSPPSPPLPTRSPSRPPCVDPTWRETEIWRRRRAPVRTRARGSLSPVPRSLQHVPPHALSLLSPDHLIDLCIH